MKKTILCYGDSNTYGYNPLNQQRYDEKTRWPKIIEKKMKASYSIVEEGCNGRTTIYDDPFEPWKNGLSYLKPCLNSHKPIELIILMLGSNDLKTCYHLSSLDISLAIEKLIIEMKNFSKVKEISEPKILLISPPLIRKEVLKKINSNHFDNSAINKSKELSKYYQMVAKRNNCYFLDAANYCKTSSIDGLHLTKRGHLMLANAVVNIISEME